MTVHSFQIWIIIYWSEMVLHGILKTPILVSGPILFFPMLPIRRFLMKNTYDFCMLVRICAFQHEAFHMKAQAFGPVSEQWTHAI